MFVFLPGADPVGRPSPPEAVLLVRDYVKAESGFGGIARGRVIPHDAVGHADRQADLRLVPVRNRRQGKEVRRVFFRYVHDAGFRIQRHAFPVHPPGIRPFRCGLLIRHLVSAPFSRMQDLRPGDRAGGNVKGNRYRAPDIRKPENRPRVERPVGVDGPVAGCAVPGGDLADRKVALRRVLRRNQRIFGLCGRIAFKLRPGPFQGVRDRRDPVLDHGAQQFVRVEGFLLPEADLRGPLQQDQRRVVLPAEDPQRIIPFRLHPFPFEHEAENRLPRIPDGVVVDIDLRPVLPDPDLHRVLQRPVAPGEIDLAVDPGFPLRVVGSGLRMVQPDRRAVFPQRHALRNGPAGIAPAEKTVVQPVNGHAARTLRPCGARRGGQKQQQQNQPGRPLQPAPFPRFPSGHPEFLRHSCDTIYVISTRIPPNPAFRSSPRKEAAPFRSGLSCEKSRITCSRPCRRSSC